MANEITRIVEAIQNEGGAVYPRDLVEKVAKNRQDKRVLQRALQAAFDKGLVTLNKDMKLTSNSPEHRQAA